MTRVAPLLLLLAAACATAPSPRVEPPPEPVAGPEATESSAGEHEVTGAQVVGSEVVASEVLPGGDSGGADASVAEPAWAAIVLALGLAEAEHDIADGRGRIHTVGGPGQTLLDRESGLPIRSVGCLVDDATFVRIAAYNRRMRRAARRGDVHTFAAQRLSREEARAQLDSAGGVTFPFVGSNVPTPRRDTSIDLRRRGDGSSASFTLGLVRDGREERQVIGLAFTDRVRVRFLHADRTLVVVDPVGDHVQSFDLASGTLLQAFWF